MMHHHMLIIINRAIFSEVGYIRRKYNSFLSLARIILDIEFDISRSTVIRRILWMANKNKNALGLDFIKNGYADVSRILDPTGLEALINTATRMLAIKNLLSTTDTTGSKNYYWKRLNYSSDASEELLKCIRKQEFSDFLSDVIGPGFCFRQLDFIYVPEGWDGKLFGSRGWHKDNHHSRIIKIFIPCHDISEESGPTFLLHPKINVGYWKFHPNNVPDKQVEVACLRQNAKPLKLVMKKGNAFAVDTSRCLHMGGRSHSSRLMVIITFTGIITYSRKWPRDKYQAARLEFVKNINAAL